MAAMATTHTLPRLRDPERELALAYVPADRRVRLRALWAIDENFGAIVAGTSEPAIGEMRLLWWRERLEQLHETVPAEPLLGAIAAALGAKTIMAGSWSGLAEGWFALLAAEIDEQDLQRFADRRGAALFALSGRVLVGDDADLPPAAGRGWALVDLATRAGDARLADHALLLARQEFEGLGRYRWPKRLRPLGMLARLAARDARRGKRKRRQGAPTRIGRMAWHRLTGR